MARRVCAITLVCSGFLATVLLSFSGVIPRVFTSDPEVLRRLHRLLPLLALQQPLVAMTLVAEGLLVGAGQVFLDRVVGFIFDFMLFVFCCIFVSSCFVFLCRRRGAAFVWCCLHLRLLETMRPQFYANVQ